MPIAERNADQFQGLPYGQNKELNDAMNAVPPQPVQPQAPSGAPITPQAFVPTSQAAPVQEFVSPGAALQDEELAALLAPPPAGDFAPVQPSEADSAKDFSPLLRTLGQYAVSPELRQIIDAVTTGDAESG